MAKLIIPIGVAGSGKTTFVKANFPAATIIATDLIRKELTGDASVQTKNGEVFRVAHQRTSEALQKGEDVVFDATNLRKWEREPLLDIARQTGSDVEAHVLLVSLEDAVRRQNQRDRIVPEYAIKRQLRSMEIPGKSEIKNVIIHEEPERSGVEVRNDEAFVDYDMDER